MKIVSLFQGLNHCLSLRQFSSKVGACRAETQLSVFNHHALSLFSLSKVLSGDALALPLNINCFNCLLKLEIYNRKKQEECKFSVSSLSSREAHSPCMCIFINQSMRGGHRRRNRLNPPTDSEQHSRVVLGCLNDSLLQCK